MHLLATPDTLLTRWPGRRRICDSRLLYWLVGRTLLRSLRPVGGQVLSRARYAEDCLEAAVAEGIEQYVIIGTGHDSFTLRRPDLVRQLASRRCLVPGCRPSQTIRLFFSPQ
jgi:hypothetical protein